MQVCPTGAITRDDTTGSVLVKYGRCISCAVCAMACPFGIIGFWPVHDLDTDRNVNAKCDNCITRLKEGIIPACAEACKTGALVFGDANDLIRTERTDFTMKLIRSQGILDNGPAVPENISAFKAVMEKIANL